MRKIKRTAILGLCAVLSLAGMSYAQVAAGVVGSVPDGALVVVKVSNMAQTSGKVAKLSEYLGLNMFLPQLGDPLGSLKQQLKLTNGVNDAGELAFVYLDPKGGDPQMSMLILVPVSDYKAAVANLEGASTEGAITKAKGADGKDMYIAEWKGYAAVSPSKEIVTAAPTKTLTLPARATKELAANDIGLYANFAALREPLTAELAKGRDEAKREMAQELTEDGEVPTQYHPAVNALVDQGFSILESFLRDTDAATVGLTLTENGIKENVVAEFKEGSYLAKQTAGLQNVDRSLLASLPAGKYLMYGGFSNSPKVFNQLIDDITGPIIKALPAEDEDTKFIPAYITDLKGLMNEVKGQSFGMVSPQGAIGQEGLLQVIGSVRGDGAKLMKGFKDLNDKYAPNVSRITAKLQPGVDTKQTWSESDKVIDDVKFSVVTTEISGDSPMAAQQRQGMQFMYGTEKPEMYFGNAGDEVLSYVGVSEDSVKALVAAAKNNESPLATAEHIKPVTDNLPKNRIGEFYIAVDEVAALALRAATQFGFFQGNVQLPPDLQPVGVGFGSDGNALEFTGYVSNDLLQALISAGMQVAAQMQGGGRGPGGGL